MSLRWPEERYVRLFNRDTANWLLGPWQARAVLPLVLRKLDRAGTLELGEDALEALAAVVAMPLDVVVEGMGWWLKKETFEIVGGWLVMPKFLDAQEAAATDAQRARESRARARDQARAGVVTPTVTKRDATVTKRDATVTKRDATVTPGHTASHAVTPSRAVPSLLSPPPLAALAEPPTRRTKTRKKPVTHCPGPEESADALDTWCRGQNVPPASQVPEVAAMLQWHQSEGKPRASWLATWRTWQRRAPQFAAGAARGVRAVEVAETPAARAERVKREAAEQKLKDEAAARLEGEATLDPNEARRALAALEQVATRAAGGAR